MPVLFKNRHLLGDKGDGSFGFGRLVVVVGGGGLRAGVWVGKRL